MELEGVALGATPAPSSGPMMEWEGVDTGRRLRHPLGPRPPCAGEPGGGRATAVPRKTAGDYLPAFFLRAAQYAVIRSDTAFFSSGVI